MNSGVKTLAFWVVVALSALSVWQVVRSQPADRQIPEISYSTFISQAQAGQIARVSVTGTRIEGEYRDGKGRFQLTGPSNPTIFLGVLQDKGVEIRFRDQPPGNVPLQLLRGWAPVILLAAAWFFMIRQIRRRTGPPSATGGSLDPSDGLR